ncbi:hypothetical protein J4G37_56675, partial [Microvirga sp. 3-52]|nr:hypothetical protein [Microvirga sp. 3-52]
GTEGTLLISDDKIQINSANVESKALTEVLPSLPMPMVQWVDSIKTGATPTITKEDVLKLTAINEAAIISHEEGRRIEL